MPSSLTKSRAGRKGAKLTHGIGPVERKATLTSDTETKFSIVISRQLENNYEFKNLKAEHIRKLHGFIVKTVGESIGTVDSRYLKRPDTEDNVDGYQVQHYAVTDVFRIHGYYSNERFHLIRLDPNHQVHK